MKKNNPLDDHIDANKSGIPVARRDAATFVADVTDLAWKAAQAVFEDRATPEIALQMYDKILAQMNNPAENSGSHT